VVDFDSTISPGREGTVTPEVKLKGLHGPFKKVITVESNASNDPKLRLTIKGRVEPIIGVHPSYVAILNGAPAEDNPTITLRTKESSLNVTDIVFEPRNAKQQGWRSMIPIHPTNTLMRDKEPDTDGYYEHEPRVAVSAELTERLSGKLRISTNLEKKPELKVNATINVE